MDPNVCTNDQRDDTTMRPLTFPQHNSSDKSSGDHTIGESETARNLQSTSINSKHSNIHKMKTLDHSSSSSSDDSRIVSSSFRAATSDDKGAASSSSVDPDLANKLSISLAAVASKIAANSTMESIRRSHDESGGVESSTSSSGDAIVVGSTRKTSNNSNNNSNNSSDRDSSTANGDSGNSRNVVTASTQTTTSSGDDRDSSGGNASGGGASRTTEQSGPGDDDAHMRLHHHHHHHYHRSRRSSRMEANDGSALQVPGDDGSDQLAGGPATVVASRLPPLRSETTTNVGSSSGSGGEESLLQPHREPGLHTIRKTFGKLPRRDKNRYSTTETSSSEEKTRMRKIKGKHGLPKTRLEDPSPKTKKKEKKDVKSPRPDQDHDDARQKDAVEARGRGSPSPDSVNSNPPGGGGGSSSGSGTEGGYAGQDENSGQNESSSSPSVSSSEESRRKSKSKRKRAHQDDPNKLEAGKQQDVSGDDSSSSEIADFSSGGTCSENGEDGGGFTINTYSGSPPASPSLSSSGDGSSDDLESTYLRARMAAMEDQQRLLEATTRKRKAVVEDPESWPHKRQHKATATWPRQRTCIRASNDANAKMAGVRPPILTLGSDIMAHVLTFLQPPEILDVLTMPLSKDWRLNFTSQPELWRVLCLVEPFKAHIEDSDDETSSSSGDSFCSLGGHKERNPDRRLLDRYRLMYTSFVRCMKYLSQIRDDAINGRPPTYIDYGVAGGSTNSSGTQVLIGSNKSLQCFLARARGVVAAQSNGQEEVSGESEGDAVANTFATIQTTNEPKRKRRKTRTKEKRSKLGSSMITGRLLGPSASGEPGNLNLPWSCAIYSIVNWMVAFSDVEGIQTLCMKVLPPLLEDEQQRMTAQRAGLTDIVLRAMVQFSNSVPLHIAAFHTIVLLARPLGGREGMLFHSSMVATGIFGGENSHHRKNGIAVMLDSMRRFEDNDILQAMSCWALVNIALAPSQKAVLVKLGGIQATANAMLRHPYSAEVQFRALFALINLVIPSVRLNGDSPEAVEIQEQLGEVNETTEKEIIDELAGDITSLVVCAMKNFCSSEAILNRACLVLHNLSLTDDYHTTLIWTPNCYQMIEWCLANYRTDQVLQQSATGTLHRLQTTLANDPELRHRFAESLHAQQQHSLEQAHLEAIRLHEQQEQLLRDQQQREEQQRERRRGDGHTAQVPLIHENSD